LPNRFRTIVLYNVVTCHTHRYWLGIQNLCFINSDLRNPHIVIQKNLNCYGWIRKYILMYTDVVEEYGLYFTCDISYKLNLQSLVPAQ